jgi:predicted RNase H-like nuclease (RuvC/YqgF family)
MRILIIILAVTGCVPQVLAQATPALQTSANSTKSNSPGDDLKRQELILAELVKLREDVTGLQSQVKSLTELVDLYKKLDANQKDQIATLKEVIAARDKIEEIYKQKDQIRADQIATMQKEIDLLKNRVETLQKRNKRNIIISLLSGIGLGLAAIL